MTSNRPGKREREERRKQDEGDKRKSIASAVGALFGSYRMPDADSLALHHQPVELTVVKASRDHDARFVMSAASPDRVRDTIDPDAYKPHLGKRLVALFGHSQRDVIGYWDVLKVESGRLLGGIKFVSTPLAQMVKTWIDEGVPLGASIGFRGQGEPNDIGSVHFSALDLLETSVVAVPAHPRAVQIAKQFGISLSDESAEQPLAKRVASVVVPPSAGPPLIHGDIK